MAREKLIDRFVIQVNYGERPKPMQLSRAESLVESCLFGELSCRQAGVKSLYRTKVSVNTTIEVHEPATFREREAALPEHNREADDFSKSKSTEVNTLRQVVG